MGIPVLTDQQILDGYSKAVANALDLLQCGQECLKIAPGAALAIAQVGQEELGKAYLLLSSAALPREPAPWKEFWRDWRKHDLKSHAAFLYEWFNPLRIQFTARDGGVLDGLPMRDPISAEKMAGLYVDFDETTSCFVRPSETVLIEEAVARIGAVIMLGNTALQLNEIIIERDTPIRLHVLARVARRLQKEPIRQESMPELLESLAAESPAHAQLVEVLKARLPWNWRPPEAGRIT